MFEYFSGQTLRISPARRWACACGTVRNVEIFVAMLCYSRLVYVVVTLDQSTRSWTIAHRRTFEYFSGVPTRWWTVDDRNLGVTLSGREDWLLNPVFRECTRYYYGVPVIHACAGSVSERVLVDGTVNAVQQRILLPLQDVPFSRWKR